ncbi:MAG TPA: VIT and VWA domain-containing protein [Methylibium sp.]|uniref:VIT and vWA domain-containing protein n=1 Tax=Methylibium sp. TaxID=2067992 RepID=UPI002DBA3F84|nr:VIT and VWA domain-containing protein [Methylibium sp.]HEU4458243.1 VIT and VWA domain-containing protein [Methylibium sp.]
MHPASSSLRPDRWALSLRSLSCWPMPARRYPLRPVSRVGRLWAARLWGAVLGLACAAAILLTATAAWADDSEARRAESPYFAVRSDDPATDRLPLKATKVDVRIAGVIADVTVTQHYRNEGRRALDARYVFPGGTRSAVHAMTVRVGDRLVSARIQEKRQARIEFEAAKREGKTGALLEQERPNVFAMNVANILPGDEVAVELRYTELVAPEEGRYRFVFPTVVGPRYRSPASNEPAKFAAAQFLREGERSNTAFDLQLSFASPLPVNEVRSASHAIEVEGEGGTQAQVGLASGDAPRNDRDFVLDWRLAGDALASGLLLYPGPDGENFFLALVEPPKAVAPAQINPRDYVFVVDISGSMHGYPLDTAKTLLRRLIGQLRPSDSFNVMLFSGSNRMLSESSVPATQANIEQALRTIDRMGGSGSTEIVPALKRVMALAKPADVSRSVIVVTDGYVTVESEVFALIRRNLDRANVFAFGIGSSVNRHLIEGIARAGQGEAFVVTRPEQAAAQAERLRRIVDSPVLTQLRARFEGLEVHDVEPAPSLHAMPDVMGGRPVAIFGKWKGAAAGRLVLEGQSAAGSWQQVVPVGTPDAQAVALRHLWARERIAQLSDQEALQGGDLQREAITALGLRYGLLTHYTSFVAIDQRVRNAAPGANAGVDQPSPLPAGVSALAVGEAQEAVFGAAVPSTPEPSAWLALAVVALLLGGAAWHCHGADPNRRRRAGAFMARHRAAVVAWGRPGRGQ